MVCLVDGVGLCARWFVAAAGAAGALGIGSPGGVGRREAASVALSGHNR